MSDQDDLIEIQLPDDGDDIFAERAHRPFRAVNPRSSMSGQVDGHDLVVPGEVGQLGAPIASVAAPAVDEYESRFSLPSDLIVDGHSIRRNGRAEKYGWRIFSLLAADDQETQENSPKNDRRALFHSPLLDNPDQL
jgi:hypothetical protein